MKVGAGAANNVSAQGESNESQGPIPVGDSFQSGAMHPPEHPACMCSISPVMLKGKK